MRRSAPAQHRNGHCAHRFHRSGFHDVLRFQRQQSVHVRAGRTTHACRRLLCRSEGAAGDAHQLVVFQQTFFPRTGHDVAEETTAHDAKFRFHVSVSPFSRRVGGFFFSSIPCLVQKSKTRRFSWFFRHSRTKTSISRRFACLPPQKCYNCINRKSIFSQHPKEVFLYAVLS